MKGMKIMEQTQKKPNALVRLWNYFTTYEKIWLFTLSVAGILVAIFFPEEQGWVQIFATIVVIGGCTCELLVSKQSKWCFVVSCFFYDIPQVVVYIANGFYVSALFEVIFWIPILWVSFYQWSKKEDNDDHTLTQVKKINWKRDIIMFIIVLAISLSAGAIFTWVGGVFEGISDYWYIDALANTFSCLNGLFLLLRYEEQWLPWYGVCICESIMWILSQQWVMLILQIGYITNTTYGLIKWDKYIKKHSNKEENDKTSTEEQNGLEEKQLQTKAKEIFNKNDSSKATNENLQTSENWEKTEKKSKKE